MADDESGRVCVCVLIFITYSPPHGKSNAIDSLSQESDQTSTVYHHKPVGSSGGREELNILHHTLLTLHGVDAESQALSLNRLT